MFIGHFTRVCHWGPLTALGIIKIITAMTIHCSNMWWPRNTIGGKVNFICFISFAGLTLYNFLSSIYHGPGYLQFNWKPEKCEYYTYLQFCAECHGYKAPRSHHCRKCGRCVLKMDHHCPWINNCVGWGNHAHFISFLTFATAGCLQASVILGCCLYKSIHRVRYYYYGDNFVQFGLYGMISCVLALGLSIGVVAAVGMLLYFQIRAVVKNRTGIEDWIMEKAAARRRDSGETFKFPYDLGTKKNIGQVINMTCQPIGDGIMSWPTAEGCNQFSLTIEQTEQKQEKRLKSRIYKIVKATSGYWFPITFGIRVCLSYPFTDESRIKLDVGDLVVVTRWRKHWLFGEKLQEISPDRSPERIRGWFPRKCAVEFSENNPGGRCVLKMDHHCPWINNCVGWGNHAHFISFLTFATAGCLQASVILGCCLYKSIHRVRYYYYGDNFVQFGLYGMISCVLALGLSIGVVAAVGMLLYFQIRAVVKNRTGIEDWIMEKAAARRRDSGETFKFPYDLGTKKNIGQVINMTCQPIGDGIMSWPTAEGCNQFSLTIEQIEQKQEKRLKSRIYKIVKATSGYWFPITFGIRVCLSYPFTDESRIKLDVGDLVVVTRWRKHWLFGEKLQEISPDRSPERIRGWFPRKCAVEFSENNPGSSNSSYQNNGNQPSTSSHKQYKGASDKKIK